MTELTDSVFMNIVLTRAWPVSVVIAARDAGVSIDQYVINRGHAIINRKPVEVESAPQNISKEFGITKQELVDQLVEIRSREMQEWMDDGTKYGAKHADALYSCDSQYRGKDNFPSEQAWTLHEITLRRAREFLARKQQKSA